MAKSAFKLDHPLEKRQAEAARIREKYPDRIPLFRHLVPANLTVGLFVYVVRKRVERSPEKAIFIFAQNVLPPNVAMMSAVYEDNKDEDGFLYMTYSSEITYGSV